MSSNILSRPIDVSKFGLIYAGAQKNIGPSGLTIVIVREDLLGKADTKTPSILDYKVMAQNNSVLNTPPCWSIYVAGLVFQWIIQHGGVNGMNSRNKTKAERLYSLIDSSNFYKTNVEPTVRSRMTPVWVLRDEYKHLEKKFIEESLKRNLIGLTGHRSIGGFRAGFYNSQTEGNIDELLSFLKEFQQENKS